jgi:hypothetical protein
LSNEHARLVRRHTESGHLQGADGRCWDMSVQPLLHEGRWESALVVVSDVTANETARREQRAQQELLAAFRRLMDKR